MSYMIDMKWLIILPLFPAAVFVAWVFWNLAREIWAERRQWVRKYSDSHVYAHRNRRASRTVSRQMMTSGRN